MLDDGGGDAAGFGEEAHAAVVAGGEGALGGGEWDVEVALGVLAEDAERAGEADGYLGDAGKVFDVAGEDGRVDGVVGEVGEGGAGLLLSEGAAGEGGGFGVVVLFIAGDGDAGWRHEEI